MLPAAAAVTPPNDLLEAAHALDVEVEQISRAGMFVTHHGWSGMQIAPTAEPSATQNAADGGRTEFGGAGNVIRGPMLTAELDNPNHPTRGSGSGAVSGRAIRPPLRSDNDETTWLRFWESHESWPQPGSGPSRRERFRPKPLDCAE